MKNILRDFTPLILLLCLLGCKTSENNTTNAEREDKIIIDSVYKPEIEYQPAQSKSFDLIHTKLDLTPVWYSKSMKGVAELTLRPYFYSTDFLLLDAKNFEVSTITLFNDGKNSNLDFENTGKQLIIDLEGTYSRMDTLILKINYEAFPYRSEASVSSAISSSRGLFFIDADSSREYTPTQLWTQGETNYNSNWFPTFDQPNIRTTQDVSITVDEGFKTLSNGQLVSSQNNGNGTRTDRWVLMKPHAPYLFMLAVGDYTVVNDDSENLKISYWVEDEYAPHAKDIFGSTPEMINFYERLLGVTFPWPKYDQIVVRDYVSGAMENTSASIFMEELQVTSTELIDTDWEGIISHELFHQWFGDLVTCESWSNLPLNEAFASYGEHLWLEYKHGPEEAAFHSLNELDDYLEEAEEKQVDLIRYYYESPEDMFDNHSYAKGARILHMLRNFVGDEAFFASLKYYLEKNAFKSVEIADLRLAFEFVTGEDLNWFFNQWFLESGHPELLVEHTISQDTLYINVNQVQDLEIAPIYQLPLFVDLIYQNGIYRYPVTVSELEHTFKIYLEEKPEAVIFDGDYQLVGIVDHQKSAKELLSQYQYGDSFYHRYESIIKLAGDTTNNHWKEIMDLALEDSSKHIRQLTLELALGLSQKSISVFKEKIAAMTKDESPQVRAAALELLFDYDDLDTIWNGALNDSSLLVNSLALEYFFAKGIKTDSLFESYKDAPYVSLQLPVAYFINQTGKDAFFDWYRINILKAHSTDRYYLIQLLSDYVPYLNDVEKNDAIQFLYELALQESYYLNRFAAAQGLLSLSDQPGVDEKINEIIDMEQDSRLLEIYNSN